MRINKHLIAGLTEATAFRAAAWIIVAVLAAAVIGWTVDRSSAQDKSAATPPGATAPSAVTLFDFEDAQEAQPVPDENVKAEPAAEHAAGGKTALKVTFPPKGGKVLFMSPQPDWSGYDYLVMDVFNPGDQVVNLRFEGGDRRAAASRRPLGAYKERFIDTAPLAPGNNVVKFRVSNAWTCEVMADPADLKAIVGFILYPLNPAADTTVFIDNIRLAKAAAYGDTELPLFDFEDDGALKDWGNLDAPEPANPDSPILGDKEHPITMELSATGATSGKRCLKLTSTGGRFPTITTAKLPTNDFSAYMSIHADITAPRQCVVIFRIMNDKSVRSSKGWDELTGRWEKACLLQPGLNHVSDTIRPYSKAVAFEITLYNPRQGESLYIDNIRLSKLWPAQATPFRERNCCLAGERIPLFPRLDRKWKVLGADMEVADPMELARKLKDKVVGPARSLTMADAEAQFKSKCDDLKKDHPNAVMAIFRDGLKGFDPRDPEKVYDGWRDVYMWGHDPPSVYLSSFKNSSKSATYEIFLRRRCPLMRVDLSAIPAGADILAAQLVVVRDKPVDPSKWKPGFLAAELCNRPWVESEFTALEYARDKFWNEVDGQQWNGDDPDFLPMIAAYGQSQILATEIDFTQAVKYWTDGKRPNYGFTIYSVYSVASDYMIACSRKAKDIQNRPTMMVIYDPPK